MKKQTFGWVAIVVMSMVVPLKLLAAETNVAVASNFMAPVKRILLYFERDTGHKLNLAFGATGQFYTQIRNGAPFSILLAADDETPLKLENEGLGVSGSRLTYATGRFVLWSKKPGFVDETGEVLRSGQFEKLAIANPKLSPYGAAAVVALDKMDLRARITAKIVEGTNITQTFQFVASENAQLGFIALSQVYENGKIKEGSGWVIPPTLHAPIKQDAVLLTSGKGNAAATAFLKYLQSEKAKAIIRSYGYAI
jgi:molybdate transport system substrate-binding protein